MTDTITFRCLHCWKTFTQSTAPSAAGGTG
jgi:hypothetical protein